MTSTQGNPHPKSLAHPVSAGPLTVLATRVAFWINLMSILEKITPLTNHNIVGFGDRIG